MEISHMVLSVILGWLFGILGPGLIDRISIKYKRESLQRIIINELKDVKKRLVMIPYLVYPRYEKLDEATYNWIKTQTENFKEFEINGDIEKKSKIFIENLKDYNSIEKNNKASFNFKKVLISITDSNLINFGILNNEFLTKLFDLKFQLNVFNEEVRSVNEYLIMTFNSNITDTNHQIISKEIKNKNLLIARKAILIVEKINKIINPK